MSDARCEVNLGDGCVLWGEVVARRWWQNNWHPLRVRIAVSHNSIEGRRFREETVWIDLPDDPEGSLRRFTGSARRLFNHGMSWLAHELAVITSSVS